MTWPATCALVQLQKERHFNIAVGMVNAKHLVLKRLARQQSVYAIKAGQSLSKGNKKYDIWRWMNIYSWNVHLSLKYHFQWNTCLALLNTTLPAIVVSAIWSISIQLIVKETSSASTVAPLMHNALFYSQTLGIAFINRNANTFVKMSFRSSAASTRNYFYCASWKYLV